MIQPALYINANDKQRRDANDVCKGFSDELSGMCGRCIDIGSGSCDVVADLVLPRMNPKASIVCTDVSESMLNFGRQRYADNHRMSFVELDIETPDLPKNLIEQFDHVTSFYCLHWCRDKRQVFENIFSLLRPGGTSLLLFVAGNPTRAAYQAVAEIPLYQPYMEDIDRYIPIYRDFEGHRETLKNLLKEVGFNVGHFSYREKSYIYKSPAVLKDALLAVNPFMQRLPANLIERYERDLMKECERQCTIFNRMNNNEYSILARYHLFVVYLAKPLSKLY